METRPKYEQICSGNIDPNSISPTELFELASQAALAGKPEIKNHIYDLILNHPQAAEDEKVRVMIHRADWMRRQGEPVEAMGALELIHPGDKQSQIEWLQAMGECHLAIFDYHRQQAISLAKEAYEISRRGNELPDKILYRLEALIARQLTVADFIDYNKNCTDYGDLLKKSSSEGLLTAKQEARATYTLNMLIARKAKKQEDWLVAGNYFNKAATSDVALVNKVVAVLEYLFCHLHHHPTLQCLRKKMVAYYQENKHALTPTIINALKPEYVFVEVKLANEK
ncbi:hypothetical protein COT97_04255 [Candidatus Falkowbacteria bacterium CG10_big_fil_rev_8_21_14_0_10_39_11]|uniref:Uncharacterized protein n=1 Tax=Candidatus Falkowbacteria bacterium CG10_big_fil_rev_8_21_14_0_10_39_11 TaxID=1974565 RepID=A0A2H0V4D0_9BACT|nr:MAG: hypothetical protein COT97_04255 [Candidatus Falkowbacteria bacterium CG10_big_fil_rev_8_21_14_0_10_39_11]